MKKRYDLLNVRGDDPQASLDSGPSVHGVVQKRRYYPYGGRRFVFRKALLKRRGRIFGAPDYRMTGRADTGSQRLMSVRCGRRLAGRGLCCRRCVEFRSGSGKISALVRYRVCL